jgi:hypothetical protein
VSVEGVPWSGGKDAPGKRRALIVHTQLGPSQPFDPRAKKHSEPQRSSAARLATLPRQLSRPRRAPQLTVAPRLAALEHHVSSREGAHREGQGLGVLEEVKESGRHLAIL